MSTGIGDVLRAAREEQGRTIEDVARVQRVRTDYLRALEDENFDTFCGDIYAKGFLRSYATELGVDPQPLLDTYRREVSQDDVRAATLVSSGPATRPTPRAAPPAWVAWLVVGVVVLVGLAFLGMVGGSRAPETASPDGDEVPEEAETEDVAETPEETPEPEPEETSDEPEEAEEEEEEPEETYDGVELLLALEEDSWLRVTVDGSPVLEQVVTAGETLQYQGDEQVEIRFGNAGGVRVEHNGEDLGSPGARGEALTVTFTPESAEGPDGQEL
jgi:cytoskeleton protein RodZ